MRAAWYHPDTGFTLRSDTPDPQPAPGEVVLEVSACGVCGSDKGLVLDGATPPGTISPVVLGHEIAGVIAATGPADEADDWTSPRWQPGDAVVAMPFIPCGTCRACRRGDTNLCLHQVLIGYHRQGGYAERVALPQRILLRRPLGLDAGAAALLTDAFATPYHALRRVANTDTPETLLVIGTGGTGLAAILLAAPLLIAQTAVLTRQRRGISAALQAGAAAGWSEEDEPRQVAREIRRWSGGGPNLILDTVATQSSLTRALEVVRPGGCVVVIGLGADSIVLPVTKTTRKSITLVTSFGSTPDDVQTLLDWTEAGTLDPSRLLVSNLRLTQIEEAFKHGRAPGRTVIRP